MDRVHPRRGRVRDLLEVCDPCCDRAHRRRLSASRAGLRCRGEPHPGLVGTLVSDLGCAISTQCRTKPRAATRIRKTRVRPSGHLAGSIRPGATGTSSYGAFRAAETRSLCMGTNCPGKGRSKRCEDPGARAVVGREFRERVTGTVPRRAPSAYRDADVRR